MNVGIRRTGRLLVTGALLLATHAGLSSAAPEPLSKAVQVRVNLDKDKVAKGADVGFVVVAKNTGNKTVVLRFATSRTFDFLIYSTLNNTVIWQRSHGLLFVPTNKQIVLSPGDKVSYRGRWNQKHNNGTIATSGQYSVVGVIAEKNGDLTSDAEDFKIKKD